MEWQSPQARTKTCRGFTFNDIGIPLALGSLATRCVVPNCPIIRAAVANAAINVNILMPELFRDRETIALDAIVMPFAKQRFLRVSGDLTIWERVEYSH